MRRLFQSTMIVGAIGLVVAGCATMSPQPASTKTVDRFYRDMANCFERARPDAVKTSTFTRYNPQALRNVIRETVSFTVAPKTDNEYRVDFAEGAPETTVISTYAKGRLASPALVRDSNQTLIDACAQRPF